MIALGLLLAMMQGHFETWKKVSQVPGAACAPCGPIETWNQTTVPPSIIENNTFTTKDGCPMGWDFDPKHKVCVVNLIATTGDVKCWVVRKWDLNVLRCEMEPKKEGK